MTTVREARLQVVSEAIDHSLGPVSSWRDGVRYFKIRDMANAVVDALFHDDFISGLEVPSHEPERGLNP